MKYFILNVSGKQFIVKSGKWYDIDFVKKAKIGDYISLKKILLYRNSIKIQIGKPFLNEACLNGQLVQNVKSKKLIVLKTKPKKNYTRVKGHRQHYSRIQFSTF